LRVFTKKRKCNITLVIHPAAKSAFNFYQSISMQFNKTKLVSFPAKQTLYSIKDNNVLRIYSGFENLHFSLLKPYTSIDNNDVILIDSRTLSDDEIELIAWTAVWQSITSSILMSKALGEIHDKANQLMPRFVCNKLFNKRKLTTHKLTEISQSKDRTTISKQKMRQRKEKKAASVQQSSTPTIFSALQDEYNDVR